MRVALHTLVHVKWRGSRRAWMDCEALYLLARRRTVLQGPSAKALITAPAPQTRGATQGTTQTLKVV